LAAEVSGRFPPTDSVAVASYSVGSEKVIAQTAAKATATTPITVSFWRRRATATCGSDTGQR
jgi:hypothetical protein